MRYGRLIGKLSGVVVRDFHSTLLMPAEGNGDFNVIFHAREALRKRNRGEAEISKMLTILRDNLLDSAPNILDISQETWVALSLPVGLLLELRRAAIAAGCTSPSASQVQESHGISEAQRTVSSTDEVAEESFSSVEALVDSHLDPGGFESTKDSPISRPGRFSRPSVSHSIPVQHQQTWYEGNYVHGGRKDNNAIHKKWAERSSTDVDYQHPSNHEQHASKRVRLLRNDGSPSGGKPPEIMDFRTWMPSRNVPATAQKSPQRGAAILLDRSAAEAGEAAATMAIQQQYNERPPPPAPPPPPPPASSSYYGRKC